MSYKKELNNIYRIYGGNHSDYFNGLFVGLGANKHLNN